MVGAAIFDRLRVVLESLQVNTRQQTERVAKKGVADAGSDEDRRPPASSGSTVVQMLRVVQTEGWGGLYSGLKPSLLGTAASQVVGRSD